MSTSTPVSARAARRTWWFVYSVWAILTVQALHFIVVYPSSGPVIDEWEFIPEVTGETPYWPFIWRLHNEHRFPVPRMVWLPVTQAAQSFHTCCYVSLIGVSLLTLLMIQTAAQVRGRLHFADAFFPISLLHLGHWENWRMGYQMVFMFHIVLAGILLRLIVLTRRDNLEVRGVQAGVVTLLLVGCGAAGLAFGPFLAIWLLALVWWIRRARTSPGGWSSSAAILVIMLAIPAYIYVYLQGYQRPEHHADALVVWGSYSEASWQALRSGLQSLSTAFGPAAMGIWPASAVIIFLGGFECILFASRQFFRNIADRPRILGLLLYLGAVAFMAAGIGWGRCPFLTEDNQPANMGLAPRYGWMTWPGLAAIYFLWLVEGGRFLSRWIPIALFVIVLLMFPFNMVTGYIEGIAHRNYQNHWEKMVRDGLSEETLVKTDYDDWPIYLQERVYTGIWLMRKHSFPPYSPVHRGPPPRSIPARRRTGRRR